jgi:GTP cyclohydrolase I
MSNTAVNNNGGSLNGEPHKHKSVYSLATPLREDAFVLTEEEKIALIADRFRDIMGILGLDLTDDSLCDTPKRVAKMMVQEHFSGLNPANTPAVTLFSNPYR